MDGGLSGWTFGVALDRWVLALAALTAAGSALATLMLPLPAKSQAAAVRLGRIAASIAVIAYIFAVGLGGSAFLGAADSLLGAGWAVGAQTSLLTSAVVGVAGMAALGAGLGRVRMLSALGIVLAVASFLVTGHAVTLQPRWLIDVAITAHLLGIAFWLGALWPLSVSTRVLTPTEAARLMTIFSRQAAAWILAIVASGAVVAAVQLESFAGALTTRYGFVLAAKLGLVAALLGLALFNNRILTPALARGDAPSARRLRLQIVIELGLFLLILAAAIGLTLVPSPHELGL